VTDALADTTARRLLARLGERQVAGRLPSIVAGVVRDGELVWSGG
jgi:3-deoxy-D-arabino-heptulosonate 7-phosphate (DAHP) synthase class II